MILLSDRGSVMIIETVVQCNMDSEGRDWNIKGLYNTHVVYA